MELELELILELEDLLQINKIYIWGNTCTLFTKGRENDIRKNNTIQKGRKENGNHFSLLSAAPVNHDQAVQLIFAVNGFKMKCFVPHSRLLKIK